MKKSCGLLAASFLVAMRSSSAFAQSSVSRSEACLYNLKKFNHRQTLNGMCATAGILSVVFDLESRPSEKNRDKNIITCSEARQSCQTRVASARFKRRMKRERRNCAAESRKAPFSCSVSPETIQQCKKDFTDALITLGRSSCEEAVDSIIKSNGTSSDSQGQKSEACKQLQEKCPDLAETLFQS